jgi:hypothetical protein
MVFHTLLNMLPRKKNSMKKLSKMVIIVNSKQLLFLSFFIVTLILTLLQEFTFSSTRKLSLLCWEQKWIL